MQTSARSESPRAATSRATARTDAGDARSSSSASTLPVALERAISRTAASDAPRFRLAISTCQPALASRRAQTSPIPEFPPVTSAESVMRDSRRRLDPPSARARSTGLMIPTSFPSGSATTA